MVGRYQSLNVLSKKHDFMTDDCIEEVANMINTKACNRAQRKRLERALNKVENIYGRAQKRLDDRAFKEYKKEVDSNMRRFYAVLGICLKHNYDWNKNEEDEQIEEMFDLLNAYLEDYKDLTTDEVCDILEEATEIKLVSTEN